MNTKVKKSLFFFSVSCCIGFLQILYSFWGQEIMFASLFAGVNLVVYAINFDSRVYNSLARGVWAVNAGVVSYFVEVLAGVYGGFWSSILSIMFLLLVCILFLPVREKLVKLIQKDKE